MTRAKRFLQIGWLVLGASLVLGGCATQPTEEAPAEGLAAQAQQAVADAEAAVQKTREESGDWGLWKSTLGILDNARASLEQEDYEAAIEAAEEAQFQAEMGLEQYREEQEEWKKAVSASRKEGDFPEEEWIAGPAEEAMAAPEAGVTRSVANGTLTIAPDGETGTYRVGKGDSLWGIASADPIYGDPFAWPLIYKANSDDIYDPDLIYPDQEFAIEWNVSAEEYDAAVNHARTRGAWSLGEPEASDLEYLERY